jgi:amino-acid N-acetyltransferase
MDLSAKTIFRPAISADNEAIRQLLREVNLPTESVDTGVTAFFVYSDKDQILGIAGFEFYGEDTLLRSVAVRPGLQSHGIGSKIYQNMLAVAKERKSRRMVLLTETAQKFFARKGFKVVDRTSIANKLMQQSSEFTVACPKSAVCMVLDLDVRE